MTRHILDSDNEADVAALAVRLDALLDELVAAGWPGEFDARERAALAKLGYVPVAALEAAQADNERLRAALEIIAEAPINAPNAIAISARNLARAALRWLAAAAATERIADDNGDELEHGAPDFPGQFDRAAGAEAKT